MKATNHVQLLPASHARLLGKVLLSVTCLALALPTQAASREERRIADATDVIDQLLHIPEQSIPPSLLGRAYGIAVIPDVIKAGFIVGARHGKGVLVVRQADGSAVPKLPDGTPSVLLVPDFQICFGDLAPCSEQGKGDSCVSREVVIKTSGALEGKYAIELVYCFDVEFEKLGRDRFVIELVKS